MTIELKSLIEDSNRIIEELRSEAKSKDTLTEAKFARMEADLASNISAKSALEARLAAVELQAARGPSMAGKSNPAADEAKSAFLAYVRDPSNPSKKSAFEASATAAMQAKAVDTATGENGGFAVHSVIAASVAEVARNYSPIRRLSRVDTVSTPDYSVLVNKGGASYRWGNQMTDRTETDAPKLDERRPTFGTLFSEPAATRQSIQDMFNDVEGWIVREIAEGFAEGESVAFLTGTGVDEPTGILHGTQIARIATGAPDGLGENPYDTLSNMFFELKGGYRQNSTWVMNSLTLAKLVQHKNKNGDYLFPQTLQAGIDGRIFGREVAIDENMPGIAPGSTPVILADWQKSYLIADRTSFWFQANPYRVSGRIFYEAEKRVGGNVLIGEAAKALRIGA